MIRQMLFSNLLILLLVACSVEEAVSNETLAPTQLAVDTRGNVFLNPTPFASLPAPVIISRDNAVAVNPSPEILPTIGVEVTSVPIEITSAPVENSLQSNHAEIRSLTDNPNLLLGVELDAQCFVAGDFIPFRLVARSLETAPIYFYTLGQWKLSINNSAVGPELASREPTARDEFVEIPPNETHVRPEEDLGLWVQSLDDFGGIPLSATGIGLPAGEYWVTFVYSNDQDGLKEQVGGTFLIDRAAWRGTTVADEIRFKVVNDLTEC